MLRRTCLVFAALCTALPALLHAAGPTGMPSVAFFYGTQPPMDELAAFDVVVLEPDHAPKALPAATPATTRTAWFAYVSLGEVHPSRPYFRDLPADWKLATNTAFDSAVIDQSRPEWAEFFAERIVRPLWERGFRGFFLDTLDSYHLAAKTDAERARQEAGLSAVIRLLKQRFPDAKLLFNRGFEILPQVHQLAYAVAAESLYRSYDHGAKKYGEVSAADRGWLTGQLRRVRDEYRLPAIVIDYVPPRDREAARATARRIAADGFVPWVANPELDVLGVGAIEVVPRRVLMLYESSADGGGLIAEELHRVGAMPLNYLGYIPEYIDVRGTLPDYRLEGRVAGIVTWFTGSLGAATSGAEERVYAWLKRQMDAGVRVAIMSDFGFPLDTRRAQALGLDLRASSATHGPLKVAHRDAMIGFEIEPFPDRRSYLALTLPPGAPRGEALLTLAGAAGERMDAAALTAWGGYALDPYYVMTLPGSESKRWVIDPFRFYARALALPEIPAPDVTTESGRRLLIVHVDGDGFPSRAERKGAPYAGEVMLKEILERYRIPHTVSIIQGEISARGLYPAQAPALEAIAKRIFALDHVEIASHSFSHPFRWQALVKATKVDSGSETYSLNIPNYTYDANTEVQGSIDYIDKVLAPPGKRTRVFLWTGDCNPDEGLVADVERAGVLNMNGGETMITRADPSLTIVAPLGIPRGKHFQVYAPNQNENVYTGLWHGPYYGFERVIETFELTESPRRLKPVDIYYHTYSATKTASLAALHKVYGWALAQSLHAVHASEYIERVTDFNRIALARTLEGEWLVRGARTLRTLRLPAAAGTPEGHGIAGHTITRDVRYVHLHADETRFRLDAGPPRGPVLADANARIGSFERRADGIAFSLTGHQALEFRLAQAERCKVIADGRALNADRRGLYTLERNAAKRIDVRCP